jgi:hypothetical protein
LQLYKELLTTVQDRSVYLEEFARTQIAAEEMHSLELRKMLRDIGVTPAFAPLSAPPEADHENHHASPAKKTAAKAKKTGTQRKRAN